MCVLRVYGENSTVEDFLKDSSLKPIVVFKKGEQYSKKRLSEDSGFNTTVSEAEYDDLDGQIKDAITFLQSEDKELKRLMNYPNIETVSLDFAINSPSDEIIVWTRRFPVRLLLLLSASNIDLEFTIYPKAEEKR